MVYVNLKTTKRHVLHVMTILVYDLAGLNYEKYARLGVIRKVDNMSLPKPQTVEINGLKLCYFEWGASDAPVVICLHAYTNHAGIWDEFGPFMEDSFHVYALDQRGHGDSSWADNDYGRDRYVADLAAFIDYLSVPEVILVGSSMGGWNSLLYTADNAKTVQKIILVDIGPEPSEIAMAPRPPRPLSFNSFQEAFEFSRVDNPWPSGDRLRSDLMRKMVEDPNDGTWRWKTDPYHLTVALPDMQSESLINRYWSALETISCPILEIRGEESPLVSDDVLEKMKKTAAKLESVDIPGAGHVVSLDKPNEFNVVARNWISG